MLNHKTVISLTLVGLLAANVAFALPGFSSDAPQSSIDSCIAEIANSADYVDASSVTHEVVTQNRRVSGHRMSIHTIVYGDNDAVIREYASRCAINGEDEIKLFRIRQMGE